MSAHQLIACFVLVGFSLQSCHSDSKPTPSDRATALRGAIITLSVEADGGVTRLDGSQTPLGPGPFRADPGTTVAVTSKAENVFVSLNGLNVNRGTLQVDRRNVPRFLGQGAFIVTDLCRKNGVDHRLLFDVVTAAKRQRASVGSFDDLRDLECRVKVHGRTMTIIFGPRVNGQASLRYEPKGEGSVGEEVDDSLVPVTFLRIPNADGEVDDEILKYILGDTGPPGFFFAYGIRQTKGDSQRLTGDPLFGFVNDDIPLTGYLAHPPPGQLLIRDGEGVAMALDGLQ